MQDLCNLCEWECIMDTIAFAFHRHTDLWHWRKGEIETKGIPLLAAVLAARVKPSAVPVAASDGLLVADAVSIGEAGIMILTGRRDVHKQSSRYTAKKARWSRLKHALMSLPRRLMRKPRPQTTPDAGSGPKDTTT
jgi:hypothetical protein